MAFNSNGQIQNLILDSLSDGQKYGLEIIEYISKKTNGAYELKKPTLYSCLTRLEKKGLVSSSFWGESELGGKRHYYTLTEQGKKTLQEVNLEDYESSNNEIEESDTIKENNAKEELTEPKKPIFLHQDNLFDLSPNKEASKLQEEKEENIVQNQIDIFSYSNSKTNVEANQEIKAEINENVKNELQAEEKKDDAKFLSPDEISSQIIQNKKIYDSSNDFKKYRNRKSFSENQIEMAVVYKTEEDDQLQKAKIDELKKSMLQARQNNYENINNSVTENNYQVNFKPQEIYTPQTETFEEREKDDAVFITNRIETNQIPVQKKITPPNIEINVSDDNLPAPKRDANLEPTYKDMMAKILERKKEKRQEEAVVQMEENSSASFGDYNALKSYYKSHGIDFKEYKKTSVERIHNTNLLNFANASIIFALNGIGSAILYWIISAYGLLSNDTNFMFYIFPILFAIYMGYTFIKYKFYPSRKASQVYNAVINWAVFVLSALVIFAINICCGMQFETMSNYLTTLLNPILAIFLIFPVNYHLKKFIYKKFAK